MLKNIDINVALKKDNTAKMAAALKQLVVQQVLAGVPAENAERRDDEEPINNAGLAYLHNTGSPAQNIPARPFMDVRAAKREIQVHMKNAGRHALAGNVVAMLKELEIVGMLARDAIKHKLQDGPFAPLAPATLAERKRHGFAGEKPLIRTGQLRNAINYVLRKRK